MKDKIPFTIMPYPIYVGSVEVLPEVVIQLVKMPLKKYQKNMEKYFGFKFKRLKGGTNGK